MLAPKTVWAAEHFPRTNLKGLHAGHRISMSKAKAANVFLDGIRCMTSCHLRHLGDLPFLRSTGCWIQVKKARALSEECDAS